MKTYFVLLLLFGLHCQAVVAATAPMTQEQLDNSLRIDFWYGGWEADYTKTAYEMMLSYRNIEDLHLFAGYGDSEQVFYDRSKLYSGVYYFYQEYAFFKVFVTQKDYDYPVDADTLKANPDSSSYDKVPGLEIELSHLFNKDLRGTLSYELFHPNFFHDPDTTITNHKLNAQLDIVTAIPELRTKLYAAILRDPDPDKTEIKGRDNPQTSSGVATTTNVVFKSSSLLGVVVEYVKDKWELEVKFLENRDLDESYDYSLLNKFIYRLDAEKILRLDYVYDKFSDQSSLSGQTADVTMISYYQQYSPKYKFGVGFKHISVPNQDEDAVFISLQIKTGVL